MIIEKLLLLLWITKLILRIQPFLDFQWDKLAFLSAQYFWLASAIDFITYSTARYNKCCRCSMGTHTI